MTKIFTLSGSHGVGKTTLINKLIIHYQNQDGVKIFNEFNTGLFEVGFALNGKGKDFDEILFSQKIAFELYKTTIDYYLRSSYDLIILDRSFIDTYVYSYYFSKYHNLNKEQEQILADMLEKCINYSKAIETILVPPFDSFTNEKNRMSKLSRDEIWEEFLKFFNSIIKCDYKLLQSANSNDRFDEVLKIISQK